MSEPKEPVHGSADLGAHSRYRSDADELEASVRAAEWRIEEARRVEAARRRLAELAGTTAGPAADAAPAFQKSPPRRRGRPAWTPEKFAQRWREARAKCGPDADDLTLATVGFDFVDGRQLQRWIAKFGRPTE